MANEVRVPLTDEQKAKIKAATGKDVPEIRVESFGSNPALSAPVATRAATRANLKAPTRANLKAPTRANLKAPTRANLKAPTKASF